MNQMRHGISVADCSCGAQLSARYITQHLRRNPTHHEMRRHYDSSRWKQVAKIRSERYGGDWK